MLKKFIYFIQYIIVKALLCVFGMLGMRKASLIGYHTAKFLGKFVKANKIAKKNLRKIFPNWSEEKINKTCSEMWGNLGRMAAEFIFIKKLSDEDFSKMVTLKNFPKDLPKNTLFVSGHFGNFELATRTTEKQKVIINIIYRNANNPYIDSFITGSRSSDFVKLHKKGKAGAKKILQVAKEGKEAIGILIDQKTNNGITVPFMGFDAKTTPFPANLAKKYKLPVVMLFIKRKKEIDFEISFSKIIYFNENDSTEKIMTYLNSMMEEEIKKTPEQWFWVHNRWK